MAEFSYDPLSRSRLCLSCGTSNPAPLQGGEHTCPKCETPVRLPPRRLEPLGDPAAAGGGAAPGGAPGDAERARLEQLRQQAEIDELDDRDTYSLVRDPEGLDPIDNQSGTDPKALQIGLALYPQIFQRAVERGDASGEWSLFLLTRALFNLHVLHLKPLQAWGVIQTSMDVITDPGCQQMLRCMAAEVARHAGQPEHAEAWLALCDPASPILELDYYWRSARALLHGARGEWTEALATLNAVDTGTRYSMAWRLMTSGLRITAYVKLGHPQHAERALENLLFVCGGFNARLLDMCNAYPLLRPVLGPWDRVDRRGPNRRRLLFLVFFFLGAAALGWFGLSLWKDSRDHGSWRPVKAKLVHVYSRESQQHHITRMHVGVRYTFEVGGRTYRGNHARPDEQYFTFTDDLKAERKLASLKGRSHVTVYYDPANPQRSALEPKAAESSRYAFFAWAGALIPLLIFLLILRHHVRRRRKLRGK